MLTDVVGDASLLEERLGWERLRAHSDVSVQVGDRNSLVQAGLGTKPTLPIGDALSRDESEFPVVVFTPVSQLPSPFQEQLAPVLDALPLGVARYIGRELARHTLVAARSGFGAGFHWHNASTFLLAHGLKKWYMAPHAVRNDAPTHPHFYTTKSTHRCVQRPGELLYIPSLWAHEVFNLKPSVGIQTQEVDAKHAY